MFLILIVDTWHSVIEHLQIISTQIVCVVVIFLLV